MAHQLVFLPVLQFKMLTLPTQRLLLSNSAWRVAEKVAQLLAWLHAAGVIHYDVKGPNIALLASNHHWLTLRVLLCSYLCCCCWECMQ